MNRRSELNSLWKRRRDQSGSALLVVLLMLGMIAALAAVVSRSVSGAAVEMSAARLIAQQESDLRTGIELGVSAISRLGESMRSADALVRLADRRIDVRVTNERGRIDLNSADSTVLTALFQANGIIESDSAAMVQSLLDWRGGSASQKLVAPAEDGHRPSGFAKLGSGEPRPDSELRKAPDQVVGTRFFLHPMQLASVPGFSKAFVTAILPLVTVANGTNQVDPYVAPSDVIAALPGVSPATVDSFLSARDGNSGREMAIKLLGVPEELVTSAAAAGWRIQIRSSSPAGRIYRCEAVIAVLDGDSEPYRVLYVLDD